VKASLYNAEGQHIFRSGVYIEPFFGCKLILLFANGENNSSVNGEND